MKTSHKKPEYYVSFNDFQDYENNSDLDWNKFVDYLIIAFGNIIDKKKIDRDLLIQFFKFCIKNRYLMLRSSVNHITFSEKGKKLLTRFHEI